MTDSVFSCTHPRRPRRPPFVGSSGLQGSPRGGHGGCAAVRRRVAGACRPPRGPGLGRRLVGRCVRRRFDEENAGLAKRKKLRPPTSSMTSIFLITKKKQMFYLLASRDARPVGPAGNLPAHFHSGIPQRGNAGPVCIRIRGHPHAECSRGLRDKYSRSLYPSVWLGEFA